MNLSKAFTQWRSIEGVIVHDQVESTERFVHNTITAKRIVLGTLAATTLKQVQEIVVVANACKVPLYPISGGRNWGYGSSLPATDNCVVLDLSQMDKIIECNEELGYVVVEPGVTQEQLYTYFTEHALPFMVPTTGAGPKGSILGNAIEKGYGITPHEDHFGAVLSLKAVLPTGELFQSALASFGGYRSDAIFRWKIGPYLEGLFTQANMGIVVQVTIALVRKPAEVTQFLAFIDDEHFEEAIASIARIKQQCGALLGGVNIMNKRRLLAMIETQSEWLGDETIPEMHIRELAKKRNVSDWVVMGGIYSPTELRSGAVKCIAKEFRPFAKHVVFLNKQKVKLLRSILKILPLLKLENTVRSLDRALNILEGVPSTVALALAYLRNKNVSSAQKNPSPDVDGCGLIWFSPLLPIDASLVRDYAQEITRICLSKNIEPLVTLTTISERCFDSTVPILFNQDDPHEVENAHECHRLLLELSKEMGVFPYRLDIDSMRREYDGAEGSYFTMLKKIKDAVDPNNIIAPGRYIPLTQKKRVE